MMIEDPLEKLLKDANKMIDKARKPHTFLNIQFIINGHLITLANLNVKCLENIEALKKTLKKYLKTNGNYRA